MAPAASIGLLPVLFSLVGAVAIPQSLANFVITKDVVILGGGASGSHAAVRLRDDYGKSVVVVEKEERLGGHVATYVDPATGHPYDYGVNSYTEYGKAKDFFARFNVSISVPTRPVLSTKFVDFTTGKELKRYESPAAADVTASLRKYLEICEKYENLIIPSYANFPENDIPEDLLMKFSDFIKKYGLEAMVPRIFQVTGMGLGNMVDELTLYVMQTFGAPITRTFLGMAESFTPASRRNQELYDNIADSLGDDVMYGATVVLSNRDANGVQLLVRDQNWKFTLIMAKKLLISFSPTLENLAPFGLDSTELDVFTKWGVSHVYAGLVTHPSLPDSVSLVNYPASAVPNNWLELPRTPFVVRYEWLGDRNFRILTTGHPSFNSFTAKLMVKGVFKKLLNGVISIFSGKVNLKNQELDIIAWADHTGIHPHLSAEEITGGFYKNLYALQGRRSTFYTGGAFAADFTTLLWEYNDQYLLPKLLESP
ncbi:hypothetical protein DL764_000565 [Monosporascus ibericus]|uniref:Amine oxidase domain-containing protein n=1 Tax=Monosporascus ibericus TaxID=155417 RepID=A0A4Q4TT05_9PEZI|nr:hypothetical protein DL764_000565 [Monosporascus ibericus]